MVENYDSFGGTCTLHPKLWTLVITIPVATNFANYSL